jgi:hypothetical protein
MRRSLTLAVLALAVLASPAHATIAWMTPDAVWAAADDGSGARRVLGGGGLSWSLPLVVSPDGTMIAVGVGTGTGGVKVVPVSGGSPRTVRFPNGFFVAAAFSPDSSRLAVVSTNLNADHTTLRVIDLATSTVRVLARHGLTTSDAPPSFSPDGTMLVVWGTHGLLLVPPDGSARPRPLPHTRGAGEPLWGPTLIAYVARGGSLAVIAPDGSGARPVVPPRRAPYSGYFQPIAWSADGSRFVADYFEEQDAGGNPVTVDLAAGTHHIFADSGEAYGISRDGSTILAQIAAPGTSPWTGTQLSILSWSGVLERGLGGKDAYPASWSR